MNSITVKNFRCFGEEQTARLAPLTLLVGDNSTGKTSFLALIRALWDVAYREIVPNFKEPPYDLGSFGDIVHYDGSRRAKPRTIEVGFTTSEIRNLPAKGHNGHEQLAKFSANFANRIGAPYPALRRVERGDVWVECVQGTGNQVSSVNYGIADVLHQYDINETQVRFVREINPLGMAFLRAELDRVEGDFSRLMTDIQQLINDFGEATPSFGGSAIPPYASAPTRTEPSRTYDPIALARDAEGEYIPTYLARTSMLGGDEWEELKGRLVDFGRDSGLFDDIRVHHLGKTEGSPFQIHARKQGRRLKGPYRNLVDMGYGVSQVLPILTEMLRPDGPHMFLLQQPEIHLHPSAQAALGTLFCSMASSGKQIIVETHSDHLIDRVRMAVRDRAPGLKPEDVSILYFERGELDVKIRSISIDEQGNITGAPLNYRKFFMEEVERSIGLRKLEHATSR